VRFVLRDVSHPPELINNVVQETESDPHVIDLCEGSSPLDVLTVHKNEESGFREEPSIAVLVGPSKLSHYVFRGHSLFDMFHHELLESVDGVSSGENEKIERFVSVRL